MPRNGRSSSMTSTRLRSTSATRLERVVFRDWSSSMARTILAPLPSGNAEGEPAPPSEQIAVAHRVEERLPDAPGRVGIEEGDAHDREPLWLRERLEADRVHRLADPPRALRTPRLDPLGKIDSREM